ncbi:MAG: hypothetical protein OQK12_06730 [Motiliproteus sp.]|nr:hypothetical protein [Motiliproteus sp.]MCW9050722.1 hypothetical protein [Motiliproteus sp.]
MLTKLLLTTAVIVGCYLFIRYKRGEALANQPQQRVEAKPKSDRKPLNGLALGLMAVLVAAAIGFFVYDYQDNQTLLEVKVINPSNGEETQYQVYKGDLGARSFETIQGQQVRIGNSERMEVREARP